MTKRTNSLPVRITFSVVLLTLLVAVRLFEREWFPEPLLDFFGSQDYLTKALPHLSAPDWWSMFLRFTLNGIFSLALLFLWTDDRRMRRFLVKFYVLAGVVLFVLLGLAVAFYRPGQYHLLFYVRRLIIQPVFLFVLIPLLWPVLRKR